MNTQPFELRDYLRQHMGGIQHVHMLTRSRIIAALSELLLWVVPAIAFVLAVQWVAAFRSVDYLQKAINQGIGPELWNVIGCFGLSLLGVASLCPRVRIARAAAHYVLSNAFGIGALTYGLLIGNMIAGASAANWQVWQAWFFGVGIAVLLLFVAIFNFFLWYGALVASPSVQQGDGLLCWWGGRPLLLRVVIASFLVVVPILFLIAER